MKKYLIPALYCSIAFITHTNNRNILKTFLQFAGVAPSQLFPSKDTQDTERIKTETLKGVKRLFQTMQNNETDEMLAHQCALTRIALHYVMHGLPSGKTATFQEAVEHMKQYPHDITKHSWLRFKQQQNSMQLFTFHLGALIALKNTIKNSKLNEQDLEHTHQQVFDEALQAQQKLETQAQEEQAEEFRAFNAEAFEALKRMDPNHLRDFSPQCAY